MCLHRAQVTWRAVSGSCFGAGPGEALPLPHFLDKHGYREGGSWHPEFRNPRHVVLGPDRGGEFPSQGQGVRWYHNLDISFRVEVGESREGRP